MRIRSPRARRILCGLALGLPLLTSSLARPSVGPPVLRDLRQDPQDRTAPFPRQGARLGKTLCKDCHEEEWDAISGGWHRDVVHGEGMVGCETCHGPGKAHGEGDNDPALITFPPKLAPPDQSRVCGQCHQAQIASHGGDPAGFLAAGKGCTACHEIHAKKEPSPHGGLAFRMRLETGIDAKPAGADQCVQCHPRRDELLARSWHSSLAASVDAEGCERCHGNGELHVATGGLARLITRPDRADDGIETCRQCHQQVDAREQHWKGKHRPLLGEGLRCTTCHTVHEDKAAPFPPVDQDPHTGEILEPTNRMCARCHAPAMTVLDGTVHQKLGGLDTPLAAGCGGCHAGAREHALSPGRKALVDSLHGSSAQHQLDTCSQCHGTEEKLHHARQGSHFRHGVTCLACHAPAAPAGKVRQDAEERCLACHQDVAAAFRLPNRHPVPEGAMACSDCHNPHDARPRVRDRKLRQDACVRCHKEYQGPFVFAHQAGRSDGCTACHVPHGASSRRLLTHATTQQICLQCHADFPAFHDQRPGALFTDCLRCHTQVHGSNHSRYLFR